MLGLTAIASAYAAWRNEQRNHDATAHFSEGIRDYDDGGQFYGEGQSVLSRDESLFLEYAKANQLNQGKLATYIFDNLMSPTLQAGVRWWEGPNTHTSHPARNPFSPHDPDYKIQQLADANTSYDASKTQLHGSSGRPGKGGSLHADRGDPGDLTVPLRCGRRDRKSALEAYDRRDRQRHLPDRARVRRHRIAR